MKCRVKPGHLQCSHCVDMQAMMNVVYPCSECEDSNKIYDVVSMIYKVTKHILIV